MQIRKHWISGELFARSVVPGIEMLLMCGSGRWLRNEHTFYFWRSGAFWFLEERLRTLEQTWGNGKRICSGSWWLWLTILCSICIFIFQPWTHAVDWNTNMEELCFLRLILSFPPWFVCAHRADLPEPASGVQPDPEAAAAGRGLQPDRGRQLQRRPQPQLLTQRPQFPTRWATHTDCSEQPGASVQH